MNGGHLALTVQSLSAPRLRRADSENKLSRGSLCVVSGLARHKRSILGDGYSEFETAIGCLVLQEPSAERHMFAKTLINPLRSLTSAPSDLSFCHDNWPTW
jgi:hypothetical protein